MRRLVGFGTLAFVVVGIVVIIDASPAGACACVTGPKPELSTLTGRVQHVDEDDDAFSFTQVVTEAGAPIPDGVVVEILARRSDDGDGRATSCDIAALQPVVGGVYRVAVNPARPSVNSCIGSYSMLAAPSAEDDGDRATLLLVLGGVVIAVAAGAALNQRRARRRVS
jgi:hypothetical protein